MNKYLTCLIKMQDIFSKRKKCQFRSSDNICSICRCNFVVWSIEFWLDEMQWSVLYCAISEVISIHSPKLSKLLYFAVLRLHGLIHLIQQSPLMLCLKNCCCRVSIPKWLVSGYQIADLICDLTAILRWIWLSWDLIWYNAIQVKFDDLI